MTTTVGRLGLDVDVESATSWKADGQAVKLTGWFEPASVADGKVLRDQLLGLAGNRDEPIVPVTCSWDSTLDGYYRVTGVDFSADLGTTYQSGASQWAIGLDAIGGWQAPRIEEQLIGALRTNSNSITTGEVYFHAIPSAADGYSPGSASAVTVGTRTSEDGNLDFIYGAPIASTVASYYLAPASYYIGAPKIEVDYTGSGDWRTVVGRRMQNLPSRVRITNGLIRATFGTATDEFITKWEVYVTNQWEALRGYDGLSAWFNIQPSITWDTTSAGSLSNYLAGPAAVTVIENSPVNACLKFTFGISTPAVVDVFVSLRRGDLNLHCYLVSETLSDQWGLLLFDDEPDAPVSVMGGVWRRDGNDDNGNRWVIGSSNALTRSSVDEVHLWYRNTDLEALYFFLGAEIGGSGSSGQLTAANLANQFYATTSTALTVTQR